MLFFHPKPLNASFTEGSITFITCRNVSRNVRTDGAHELFGDGEAFAAEAPHRVAIAQLHFHLIVADPPLIGTAAAL
jgi:hypothetical protein